MGKWTAKWQEVAIGDPRYIFGVKDVYSNELTIVKRYEPPPDISIDNVSMVSNVKAGELRTDTVTIKSDESELVVVRLKGYSSLEGEFYNLAVSIPANGYTEVETQARFNTAGPRSISYKLYYQGVEFSSWSGLLEVSPSG